jgi:hypothetical protein
MNDESESEIVSPESEPVFAMIDLVDELIQGDRENAIRILNEEIDRVQSRFTVLSAIRDSLLAEDEPDAELPLATEENLKNSDTLGADHESLIVQHIGKHGPSMPGDIAAAIGVHSTKIGRIVSKSNQLAKDGKLIVIRNS